jgi:UDP-glucose 4-epimerase
MKHNKGRFLVTGAAGFIGLHLTRRLVSLGAEVTAVDDFFYDNERDLKQFDIEVIRADVCQSNLDTLVQGDIDCIFHFGAPSSVILFNRNPLKRFGETVVGMLNIMELAKKKNVRKLVYPSSGSVYGRTQPPQSEAAEPQPVNLYGVGKLTCEKIAELYQDNVKSVGLRIFAGYGPGESHKGEIASPVTIFLRAMLEEKRPVVFGDGTQSRDFVYIDDIIAAILKSSDAEVPPILNVGSGRSYSFNDTITIINELTGEKIEPEYIKKPVDYLETTQADTTLLAEALSIRPIDLKEGLNLYLQSIGARLVSGASHALV